MPISNRPFLAEPMLNLSTLLLAERDSVRAGVRFHLTAETSNRFETR
jgi:hypothetical protein